MEVAALAIPDVKLLRPRIFEDLRGFFCETFNGPLAEKNGLPDLYIQDNLSLSRPKGTVRGLHFQKPPFEQAKLIRVPRGRILDVAVDIRKGSPTYGRHVAVELSPDRLEHLFIPAGFAHGFCTLTDDTEVFYKVTKVYSPAHDSGISWNDPALGIDWPVSADAAILSDKDRKLPCLKDMPDIFFYDGAEKAA